MPQTGKNPKNHQSSQCDTVAMDTPTVQEHRDWYDGDDKTNAQ